MEQQKGRRLGMQCTLRSMIKERYGTQERLAAYLGWHHTKVSKLLYGKQSWTDDDIIKVAKSLNEKPSYIGSIVREQAIVDGTIYSHLGSWDLDEEAVWRFPRNVVNNFSPKDGTSDDAYKIYRVNGQANAPRFKEGWFLIVDTSIKSYVGERDYLLDMGEYNDTRYIESYVGEDGRPLWSLASHAPDRPVRAVNANVYTILGAVVGQIQSI